jgi:hypothetical protein
MNLYPFQECADRADMLIRDGAQVFQQWLCEHCGVKQTMPDPDKFYVLGKCEECGRTTNIVKNGCNYMVTFARRISSPPAPSR